ncbi:MAG: multidrug efflux SMR transporter [Oligoflexales bacterium]|nr:multidrug efflux SMR transporter [Oligoflexales bacterium]
MSWLFLGLAGVFEIFWAIGLKHSFGLPRFGHYSAITICMGLSIYFLATAMKTIPLGTAYAVWTGIGSVGVAVIGIIFFSESVNLIRLLCILLILAGVVGLKLVSR